jgi:hypothetical protein
LVGIFSVFWQWRYLLSSSLFLTVLYFVSIKRPEAFASLLERQADYFQFGNEEHAEIDPSGGDERVLLGSDAKGEVGNEDQQDNAEKTRVDQNEEGANNNEKAAEEEKKGEQKMDKDVSRKYPVIATEEERGKVGGRVAGKVVESPLVPPAARKLLLFVAVLLGLVVSWYARKVQRKRSGWHKKIDATLSLPWYTTLLQGRARPDPVGHRKQVRRNSAH